MPARRRLVLLACACALALVPASARAGVQTIALATASNGVAVGADGDVYVVESYAQQVTVFTPAGALVRHVALPGPAGSATSAALGPDGQVWVALGGGGPDRGFVRIATDGTATARSTAAAYGCGPVGVASLGPLGINRMAFTAPDAGPGCGTHGLGGVNPDGSNLVAGPTTPSAFDLEAFGGKLFVPLFDSDQIVRYGVGGGGAYTQEAVIPAPGNPDGIAVGSDGQLYVTLYGKGQVARLAPAASVPSDLKIVASGLVNPFGIAAHPDGGLYVASNGDARLVRIAPDGTQRSIALPAGFHPWQVAVAGRDVWVTDNATAQVARVFEDPAPAAPVAETPAPAPTVPAPAVVPAVKPKFAQVLSVASAAKCLSRRALTLTVRKRKAGAKVTSVKVTIGKGKAKTYKGTRLKVPVKLTGLPKGTFRIKVAVVLADGTKLNLTRTYRTCAPKKHRG